MPDPDRIIREGDIVTLDITLEKDGFIADSSKTYILGEVSAATRRLVRVAQGGMWKGIGKVRPGAASAAIVTGPAPSLKRCRPKATRASRSMSRIRTRPTFRRRRSRLAAFDLRSSFPTSAMSAMCRSIR